jgi:Tol biopolymer transport system component
VISRYVLAILLTALVLLGGVTSYLYLGTRQSKVAVAPQKPTAATPRPQALSLPGTLYLAQSGALYSLSAGRFHQLTSEAGWAQPSLSPDGSAIIAVKYGAYWSDVYVLNRYGTAVRQITTNQARSGIANPSLDHWSFFPRVSPDGSTLWMTYDGLKCDGCYDVSPAVYAMPFSGTIRQARAWTDGGYYSGGDQQPIPVAQGGVIYTKYDFASKYDANQAEKIVGMLWYTNRANSYGRQLTTPGEDCREPSLSPDGTQVAMICTYQKQVSYLTIATWNGSTFGSRRTLISNQLVAQPTWAPDGSGIAYYAPGVAAGPFQLWFLPRAAYAAPPPPPPPTPTPGGPHNGPLPSPSPSPPPPPVKPIQVTTNAGFDATSPMAWAS